MAFRLFGDKALSEPVLAYSSLEIWKQSSVKFEAK